MGPSYNGAMRKGCRSLSVWIGLWVGAVGLQAGVSPAEQSATRTQAEPVDQLVVRARQALSAGHYQNAAELFERVLLQDASRTDVLPHLRQAYEAYATALLQARDVPAARRYFLRLRTLHPDSIVAAQGLAQIDNQTRQVHQRIQLLLDLGRFDEAERACRRAMQQGPDQRPKLVAWLAWAEIGRAEGAFGQRDFARARRHYDQAFVWHRPIAVLASDRWAHCHLHRLVDQVNREGLTDQQLPGLEHRARSILKILPDHAYGHYVLGAILENRGQESQARTHYLRATPQAARRHGSATADLGTLRKRAFRTATRAGIPLGPRHVDTRWHTTTPGRWRIRRTRNFVIHHHNDFAADRIAAAAEYLRYFLYQKWGARIPSGPWRIPCEIYLFRTVAEYAAETGRGPNAPGHALVTAQGRTVTTRRIDCRQDDAQLIASVLPHEITHVVVFDLMSHTPPPRWADEGMAVHGEHPLRKWHHARVLDKAVRDGLLFPLRTLVDLKAYPSGDRLDVFYAQSCSLVEHLLGRASTTQFVRFATGLNGSNIDARLRTHYGIGGLVELQRLWQPRLTIDSRPPSRQAGPTGS